MKTQENSIIINFQYKPIKDSANQININILRNSRLKSIIYESKYNNLYLKHKIEEIKSYFLSKKNYIYNFYIIKMLKILILIYVITQK